MKSALQQTLGAYLCQQMLEDAAKSNFHLQKERLQTAVHALLWAQVSWSHTKANESLLSLPYSRFVRDRRKLERLFLNMLATKYFSALVFRRVRDVLPQQLPVCGHRAFLKPLISGEMLLLQTFNKHWIKEKKLTHISSKEGDVNSSSS